MEVRKSDSPVAIITDPQKSAEVVGLTYVSNDMPGIQRVGSGKHFKYLDANGTAETYQIPRHSTCLAERLDLSEVKWPFTSDRSG